MKKTYYDESTSLNEDGSKLSLGLDQYFDELFSKEMRKGHSLRELTQILYSSISYVECKKTLEFSNEYNKQRRMDLAFKDDLNSHKRETANTQSE